LQWFRHRVQVGNATQWRALDEGIQGMCCQPI
jgi:hypothetical protein